MSEHTENIEEREIERNLEQDFDVSDLFNEHTHNGVDSKKIAFSNVTIVENAAITAPTGGMTIDSEARTAINSIITELENRGLITPN